MGGDGEMGMLMEPIFLFFYYIIKIHLILYFELRWVTRARQVENLGLIGLIIEVLDLIAEKVQIRPIWPDCTS